MSEDAFDALKVAEERADAGLVCARTQVNPGGSAHALMMAQVAVALGGNRNADRAPRCCIAFSKSQHRDLKFMP